MQGSEYGWFHPKNTCPCCGAGTHNSYRHDENCLTNIPIELMPTWRDGWNARIYRGDTAAERAAYAMGLNCKEAEIIRAQGAAAA